MDGTFGWGGMAGVVIFLAVRVHQLAVATHDLQRAYGDLLIERGRVAADNVTPMRRA